MGLDVLGNVDANSRSEDSIDLGLVDEFITDSTKVLEEVLGDIDLVLELVVGVGVEPFKGGIAWVALRVGVV